MLVFDGLKADFPEILILRALVGEYTLFYLFIALFFFSFFESFASSCFPDINIFSTSLLFLFLDSIVDLISSSLFSRDPSLSFKLS